MKKILARAHEFEIRPSVRPLLFHGILKPLFMPNIFTFGVVTYRGRPLSTEIIKRMEHNILGIMATIEVLRLI